MADQKEIKRRIKSVRNIGQITKALQLVSAVKMKRAQLALHQAQPYFDIMADMFTRLLSDIDDNAINLLIRDENIPKRKAESIALIVISPSKGFAGPLITNLAKKTVEFLDNRSRGNAYENTEFVIFTDVEHPENVTAAASVDIKLITVEKKSRDIALKVGKEMIADFPVLSVPPTIFDITPITTLIKDSYKDGTVDEVYIVYTHFMNSFLQKAVIKKILPFEPQKKQTQNNSTPWMTYSSNKENLAKELYPVYLDALLFHAALDAVAAEHSARMIAMQNATDNARDLRKDLTLEYNQRRQAAITQQIAEITSAADAV